MITVYCPLSTKYKFIYVGQTNNLSRRLHQHNSGQQKSTKHYKPFKLILSEKFENRKDARMREIYLKSGVGKEFLKGLLQESLGT